MQESPSTCSTRRRNSGCTSPSRLPRSSPFSTWRSFGAPGFCPCRHTLRKRKRRLGKRNNATFGGSCRGGGGCRRWWQRGCGWRDHGRALGATVLPVSASHYMLPVLVDQSRAPRSRVAVDRGATSVLHVHEREREDAVATRGVAGACCGCG